MDRSLDEIVAEHQKSTGRSRGSRGGQRRPERRERRDDYPRDGVRKSFRDEPRKLDDEWVHDRFEDNAARRTKRRDRRESPEYTSERGTKVRVDNLHYDLSQEDLEGLFRKIGPVTRLELVYDRAGRSEGTAYVTYELFEDAREAVKEYDGAKAHGQEIHLTIMPSGPGPRSRNPFDNVVKPGGGRSLADRITRPSDQRNRSLSPGRELDDDAARRGIDRYVPGQTGSRSRSPLPRGGRRDGGRRPGDTRSGNSSGRGNGGGGGGGGRGGGTPRQGREGRPKKTQEELDAEMADYFGGGGKDETGGAVAANGGSGSAAQEQDDDMDMI